MSTDAKGVVLENTTRRDALIDIEKKYKQLWAEEKPFEVDAPTNEEVPYGTPLEELHEQYGKYFSSMAYPYMNGVLHAGHSFTYSKADFATGFERLRGKRALFPLGFHCTGMPICAAADKLKREIELFGQDFTGYSAEAQITEEPKKEAKAVEKTDPTKFIAKKSKVAQKAGTSKYQFQIMQQLGIPTEEIHKFADPYHWCSFFPPLTKQDVTAFGGSVDWRRSMITTDMNPYYDSFVQWQMRALKESGKIKFGERYTIYSVKDGQPCMDHDRQSGEAVLPQEYTGIKIQITDFTDASLELFKSEGFDASDKKIFLIAATLRPETMFGQTCCFVSPKIKYGLFDAGNGSYYITTHRAFKNMSYQKLTPKRGEFASVLDIDGKILIGSKIHAPLTPHKELRVLPMDTVLENKGTGVVTCVPSDSPDDFITTRDLYNKPDYYNIKQEWVITDIIPVVKTVKYGDKCAEYLVNELKINSPKDFNQLSKAKELSYKEGYYNGTLIWGKYAGEKVEVAKVKVKQDLVASGEAFVYNEPESLVMSRSGDECIVSLEDQWYLDYGEPAWRAQVEECLQNMSTFNDETKNAFEGVLDWLKNWAVSRTYGLGTRIPWDPKYLVESLSDSTIYQAFYTIGHLLHSDFYGKVVGPLGITAEQMTDKVWDYIFFRTEEVPEGISNDKLQLLRREFEFFYPLDMSASGKDLIPNHLTFFIYCNVALFPKKFWPAGIRANGHLMLNNAKMSKSTGNFRTLSQLVEKFGADASRIALADGGDSIEDANFDESNANAAILRLYNLKEWIEDIVKNQSTLRTGEYNLFDKLFDNEMNSLIEQTYQHYDATYYKAALKTGLFDYQYARDYYREVSSTEDGMHKDLVLRYIETQVILLSPFAPHFADYVYREQLGHKESVFKAKWPKLTKPVSQAETSSLEFIRLLARSIRETEGLLTKKKKGGKPAELDKAQPAKLSLFICASFPEWQGKYVELVRKLFEASKLDDMGTIKKEISKQDMKKAMPFINELKKKLATSKAEEVFDRELDFNEIEVVKAALNVLKKAPALVSISEIKAYVYDSGAKKGKDILTGEEVDVPGSKSIDSAVPGQPAVFIKNL